MKNRMLVSRIVPGLRGHGVLLAAPQDTGRLRWALADHGFAIAEAYLPDAAGLREAQARIAAALHLPESAGRNLDALVDSLRDLAVWWPDQERVALLVHGAEALVATDLPGWQVLTAILRDASDDLWRGGMAGDRAFETVALVDGHGVTPLAGREESW